MLDIVLCSYWYCIIIPWTCIIFISVPFSVFYRVRTRFSDWRMSRKSGQWEQCCLHRGNTADHRTLVTNVGQILESQAEIVWNNWKNGTNWWILLLQYFCMRECMHNHIHAYTHTACTFYTYIQLYVILLQVVFITFICHLSTVWRCHLLCVFFQEI